MAELLVVANKVCGQVPEGWEVQLCMERGAAWVTLRNPDGDFVPLPDAADKSIEEQINDALVAARRGIASRRPTGRLMPDGSAIPGVAPTDGGQKK